MADLIGRLRAFEGSDELGNGDFSLLTEAATEIERLRAEVAEAREFRDKLAKAIGNEQLRMFIEKHGEPVPLTTRMQQAEARAERLAEALEQCITSMLDSGYRTDSVVIRAAREALAAKPGGAE